MSEVALESIYSEFNEAKKEYILLLSEINTSCLGDTVSVKCASAAELNTLMQDYLIQMSNLVKPSTEQSEENQVTQAKIVEISKQLQEEKNELKVLETNKALEKDTQVISAMKYHHAMIWLVACIAIVLLLYNQSLILFFACIMIVLLLYHQLWFLACITAGLLYYYLAN